MKTANKDIFGDPCINKDKGQEAFSVTEKLMAWKEHYQRLINVEFKRDESTLTPTPRVSEQPVSKTDAKMANQKVALA